MKLNFPYQKLQVAMVVNTKADRQHVIASALELPSTWAEKADYYNLGVQMANV